jgi:hypothetical protein
MSETTNTTATTTPASEPKTSFVDQLFDVGIGWASLGLKAGKAALEQSAKTLEATAKALEGIAKELEKKDEASAPAK